MTRLRDLDIAVGALAVGPRNEITDVAGVRVGHVDIDADGLMTGITAVLPYPSKARKLFIGRYGLDGGDGMSGLGVTEDFGAVSTPIMLAPAAAVGAVYDAMNEVLADPLSSDEARLRFLIERHATFTKSQRAQKILNSWKTYLPKFVKVMPVDYRRALLDAQSADEQDQISLAAGE